MMNCFFYLDKVKLLMHNICRMGYQEKRSNRPFVKVVLIALFMVLYCYQQIFAASPDLQNGQSQEQLESEVAEHYEKAVDKFSTIYDKAINNLIEDPDAILQDMSLGQWIYYHIYSFYKAVCAIAPYLGAMSILFGIMICFMIRRNKALFKKVLVYLVIGIPSVLLIIVFGVGIII